MTQKSGTCIQRCSRANCATVSARIMASSNPAKTATANAVKANSKLAHALRSENQTTK